MSDLRLPASLALPYPFTHQMTTPRIEADGRARAFIADSGGNVFVWCDGEGLEHTTTSPPPVAPESKSFDADGFMLHVDATIGTPLKWQVVFHHLPHKHVAAICNGDLGALSAAAFPAFRSG